MSLAAAFRWVGREIAANPGFFLCAVAVIGLGLGAATAIFEIVNTVVIRPLPYRDADSLVRVAAVFPSFRSMVSHEDFENLRAAAVFERIALFHSSESPISGLRLQKTEVNVSSVSADYFAVCGTSAFLGRTLSGSTGEEDAAILSYHLWQETGASPDVVGQSVRLGPRAYTVAGVMPPDFELLDHTDIWVPLTLYETANHGKDSSIIARLRAITPGVTLKLRLAEISARLSPQSMPYTYELRTAREIIVGKYDSLLTILAGSVVFVALLSCSNLSHLILSRHAKRRGEMAVRIALGAGPSALLLPLVAEGTVICLLGLGLGLAAASWISTLAQRYMPVKLPRLEHAGLDGQAFAFAVVLAVFALGLATALPAVDALRLSPSDIIKGISSVGRARRASKRPNDTTLLAVNAGLATVFSIGAVLMLRSIYGLLAVDVGFSPDNLFTARIALDRSNYLSSRAERTALQQMLEAVQVRVGASKAAFASSIPFGGDEILVQVDTESRTGHVQARMVDAVSATPGLMAIYGTPILAGRDFTENDIFSGPKVVLINRTLAKMLWPKENPVGKRLRGTWGYQQDAEVVGEVGDIRSMKLQTPAGPAVYLPFNQLPHSEMYVVVRGGPEGRIENKVLEALHTVDKGQRLEDVHTEQDLLGKSLRQPKFVGSLLSGFAALALLLSAVGVFAVVSQWVAQSTREIAVHMVVGAEPANVVKLIIGRSLRVVASGAALGIATSLAVMRVLESFAYGVSPREPLILALGASVVVLVTLVATFPPAIRAASVDPILSLRQD